MASGVEVVEFKERFCGRKIKKETAVESTDIPSPLPDKITKNDSKIFNIKRARYEVMRFGLTGFDKEKQKQDKIAMAIRLGAKPPKRSCVNYKVLMERKIEEKKEKQNQQTNQYILQKLKGRKKNKPRKSKNQPNNLV